MRPAFRGVQLDFVEKHWRLWLLLMWAVVAAWLIYSRWAAIRGFALPDTDDNMRMMQVRALIEGQGWFDLRQYRLNPPVGADIHWSRLVDLPLAALKLAFAPFVGGANAEKAAAAAAPLLPMLVAMAAISVVVRRLVGPKAFVLAILLLACAGSARGMWTPMRIDHHGWQLAMLALTLVALTDPNKARGGALLGGATALSLAIGMEMLLYFALAGAMTALRWVIDRQEARRLAVYGAALGGGCTLAFLLFASEANRAPVCDALSPVWLSAMLGAGAGGVLLAITNPTMRSVRVLAAAAVGLALAGAFAFAWPDCLGRLERAPPALERLWLEKVREAMPIYRHGARIMALVVTLPVAGLLGYSLMLWTHRGDRARLAAWAMIAAPAFLAAVLLLWQTRAGPAAQLLSIPGAAALAWAFLRWVWKIRSWPIRLAGAGALIGIVAALYWGYPGHFFPPRTSEARRLINLANARCPTLAALAPIGRQPPGKVLTFVDLGPRLITVTAHNALAGPYHRNARQIIDVMRAWRGDVANAHATVRRYDVDYVLICPNLSESTIYRAEAPGGFYAQLARGRVPGWLDPITLPPGSPYRLWRVRSASPS